MKAVLTFLALLLVAAPALSACQSVPAVRKNHCACKWQDLTITRKGRLA